MQKKPLLTIATENKQVQYKLLAYYFKHNRESIYPWDIFIPGKDERLYMNLDSISQKVKELKNKIY